MHRRSFAMLLGGALSSFGLRRLVPPSQVDEHDPDDWVINPEKVIHVNSWFAFKDMLPEEQAVVACEGAVYRTSCGPWGTPRVELKMRRGIAQCAKRKLGIGDDETHNYKALEVHSHSNTPWVKRDWCGIAIFPREVPFPELPKGYDTKLPWMSEQRDVMREIEVVDSEGVVIVAFHARHDRIPKIAGMRITGRDFAGSHNYTTPVARVERHWNRWNPEDNSYEYLYQREDGEWVPRGD